MTEFIHEKVLDSDTLLSYDGWLALGRPSLIVTSLEVAFEQLYEFAEDECVDNHRWYNMDTGDNQEAYEAAYNEGCCGYFDQIFYIEGSKFTVGINYGH